MNNTDFVNMIYLSYTRYFQGTLFFSCCSEHFNLTHFDDTIWTPTVNKWICTFVKISQYSLKCVIYLVFLNYPTFHYSFHEISAGFLPTAQSQDNSLLHYLWNHNLIKQTRCRFLIRALQRCWYPDFVTCIPRVKVKVLERWWCQSIKSGGHDNYKDSFSRDH